MTVTYKLPSYLVRTVGICASLILYWKCQAVIPRYARMDIFYFMLLYGTKTNSKRNLKYIKKFVTETISVANLFEICFFDISFARMLFPTFKKIFLPK